jgi:hypothetical protein
VEIDYHAMHAHLMYYWENEQCPDDFYEMVMSQCGCSRFIAKICCLGGGERDYLRKNDFRD